MGLALLAAHGLPGVDDLYIVNSTCWTFLPTLKVKVGIVGLTKIIQTHFSRLFKCRLTVPIVRKGTVMSVARRTYGRLKGRQSLERLPTVCR